MTTPTTAKLTTEDLAAVLEDDRHLGWGYATSRHLPKSKRERLDKTVIAVANELGMTREELFHWTNHKNGRWLVDRTTWGKINRGITRDHVYRVEAE